MYGIGAKSWWPIEAVSEANGLSRPISEEVVQWNRAKDTWDWDL